MKKILVISANPAPPIQAGNQKCIIEYCNLLHNIGCEVYFLYIEGRQKAPIEMFNYWGEKLFVYKKQLQKDIIKRTLIVLRAKLLGYNHVDDLYPIGLTKYVKKLQQEMDFNAIIINYINLSKLFKSQFNCKKILFTHDCMTFKKAHLGVCSFWFDLTPNQEAKGLRRCDTIISIQENESIFFRYLYPGGNVKTIYSYFKAVPQPLTGNKNILFLSGKSDLNINGINYFIRDVFPLVLQKEPDAKLIIGGSICDSLFTIDENSIVKIGRVDNVEQFYALGDIAINPVYQGTGLKIKTFEALSYGKVTIVHPHSAEGIYDKFNAPIIQCKTPSEYATHLIEMLSNIEKRKEISNKSIEYIHSLNLYIAQQYKEVIMQ